MTQLDEAIRSLVADGLAEAPRPLTPTEIVDRGTELRFGRSLPARRRPRMHAVLATTSVAAATLIGATIYLNRDPSGGLGSETQDSGRNAVTVDPPVAPSNAGSLLLPTVVAEDGEVGIYFLPTNLPEGWRVVDVVESPGVRATAWSDVAVYERKEPYAFIRLFGEPAGGVRVENSGDQVLDIPGASFARSGWMGPDNLTFDVAWPDRGLRGEVAGLGSADLPSLIAQVSIDPQGMPMLDPTSGFLRVGATPSDQIADDGYLVVELQGPADGDFGVVTIRRRDSPPLIDEFRVLAGPASARRTIEGREIWISDDEKPHHAVWAPAPNVILQVSGSFGVADDLLASLALATYEDLEAAAARPN